MTITKSPRAIAVEAMPLNPLMLAVAGDPSTPAGARYAGSWGDDYRQLLDWTEKHELQVLHLISTAKPIRIPVGSVDGKSIKYKTVNVALGEPVKVFLQTVANPDPDDTSVFSDDRGAFDVVTDDGRQRRRDAIVAIARLRWIADEFVRTIWQEIKDSTVRKMTLRERLLAYGPQAGKSAARHVEGANTRVYSPHPAGRKYIDGEILAPWLTEAFVNALTGDVPWFDDHGEAVPLYLRPDVAGENVDLADDHTILVNNVRSKEASVPTPLRIAAMQRRKLLAKTDKAGNPVYTPHSLAQTLGISSDSLLNSLYYTEIIDEVREAVDRNQRDEGGVALKLAVTGRDCICYGFDRNNKRTLLSPTQQITIWGELLKAFSVEALSDTGIPDNDITRKILRKIKTDVLAGTDYIDMVKPVRETRSVIASKAAAEKMGLSEESTKPAVEKKKAEVPVTHATAAPAQTSSHRPATDIREALLAKARSYRIKLPNINVLTEQKRDRAVALAVALAVAEYYETADPTVFDRFPVLAEAVAPPSSQSSKSGRRLVAAKIAKSPWSAGDRAKEILANALDLAEESGVVIDVETDAEQQLKDLITVHLKGEVVDVAAANKLLDDAITEYTTSPRHQFFGVHVREFLFA